MAEHGAAEYTTAEGNDLPEHEATYERFIHLTFVAGANIASVVIALAIGAVNGNWWVAVPIIFIAAPGAAWHGMVTGARAPSLVLVLVALLALAMTGVG